MCRGSGSGGQQWCLWCRCSLQCPDWRWVWKWEEPLPEVFPAHSVPSTIDLWQHASLGRILGKRKTWNPRAGSMVEWGVDLKVSLNHGSAFGSFLVKSGVTWEKSGRLSSSLGPALERQWETIHKGLGFPSTATLSPPPRPHPASNWACAIGCPGGWTHAASLFPPLCG